MVDDAGTAAPRLGTRFTVDAGLAAEVTARLGMGLPRDLTDVDRLYDRWLDHVWFDPISKMIARREGRVPDGADADAWCRRWLETGLGGTCWGQSVAFSALLATAGADPWISLERMIDVDGVDFHCAVVVEDGDPPLLYDLIHATSGGLPIRDGATSTRGPASTTIERAAGRILHRSRSATRESTYHVLATHLDRADVEAFLAVSATHSGLAHDRFFARLLPGAGRISVRPAPDGRSLEVEQWTDPATPSTRSTYADVRVGLEAVGWPSAAIELVVRSGVVSVDGDELHFVT